MFRDETGRLRSLPLGWTDLAPPDPFVIQAAGRTCFHVADLGQLVDLLQSWTADAAEVFRE